MASGISGVQPKLVVPMQPDDATVSGKDVIAKNSIKDRSLIVKSSGEDLVALAENEFICMSIAKKAGLDVPEFWLSDDKKLFVVERFDITQNGCLGFEDMTALMNRQNDQKYDGSYEQVAKAIALFASGDRLHSSLRELFSSVTLSVLLRNGDAHLKNFGMLYTDPTSADCRLSPLYDVVNTTVYLPKDALALKLAGTKAWASRNDLIEFGKRHCQIDHPEPIIERIATVATEYIPPENSEIWQKMKPIIDFACFGLAKKPFLSAT